MRVALASGMTQNCRTLDSEPGVDAYWTWMGTSPGATLLMSWHTRVTS
jgi:hypothetical protein